MSKRTPKNLKGIKAAIDSNTLLSACALLEHRANIENKQKSGYRKDKEILERSYPHHIYRKGFEAGYRYAVERLKRHSG